MRSAMGLVLALACAGCAATASNQSVEGVPTDYRATIAAQKATLFKDPASVRDAAIGTPKANMFGWQVCLKANAKNSFGGYAGLNMYSVQLYRNGSPPLLQQTTIYDGCGSDYFAPFAEINGDYQPPAPPAAQPADARRPGAPKSLRSPT